MPATMMSIVTERMLQEPEEDLAGVSAPRSEKRQITRNRTSYSCQSCRRRKVRCDKGQPICSGCLKTGDECVYGQAEQAPVRNGTQSAKRRGSVASNDMSDASQIRHAAAPGNVIIHGLEQQLGRLADLVETMRRESSHTATSNGLPSPTTSTDQMTSEAGTRSRQASSSLPVASDALIQKAGQLSQSLAELDITKSKESYVHTGKENFWSHLASELKQLQYLIHGAPTLPAERSLTEAMGIEQHECNRPSAKPDPDAIIDECLDMHTFQTPRVDASSLDCWSCHVKSGDKSALLLPRRLKTQHSHNHKVDLLAAIPTEVQSHVLFRAWMSGVYPALPVIPLRITFLRYQRFWQWKHNNDNDPVKSQESADIYIMPLLFAIWYTGALSLSTKAFQRLFPDVSRAGLCATYHDECIRMLDLVSFPTNAQNYLLAAVVMLQSVPCAEEEPQQSSAYINLMVRLAQSMGMHREPTLQEGNPFDAETRRRVWWQIIQLDTYLAVSSGFPTLSTDATADARRVSQVKEMFIASPEEKALLESEANGDFKIEPIDDPFGPSLSVGSVSALVMRAYSSIAVATRKIVTMHMRTKPVDIRDLKEMNEVIATTEEEVRVVMKNIPCKGVPELGFMPDDASSRFPAHFDNDASLETPPTDAEVTFYTGIMGAEMPPGLARFHRHRTAAFHKWARIYLSMMCDKMHCIAYAPFLKNLKSKLWGGGRQCALHHCSAYFRKFLSLANDPSLEPFRWNWPGTAQPMHAAIILLVDLYERPHSIEAPRSRSLIDEVFSLSAPINGIVGCEMGNTSQRPFREGGADAWEMLRNLRATAWRKAGLDPDVLWTEEQQVLIGLAQPLTMEQKIARSIREDTLYDNSTPETGDQSRINKTLQGMFDEMTSADAYQQLAAQGRTSDGSNPKHPHRLPGQQPMPFPLLRKSKANGTSHSVSIQAGNGAAAYIDANRFNANLPEELTDHALGYTQWPSAQVSPDNHNGTSSSGASPATNDSSLGSDVVGPAELILESYRKISQENANAAAAAAPHLQNNANSSSPNGVASNPSLGSGNRWLPEQPSNNYPNHNHNPTFQQHFQHHQQQRQPPPQPQQQTAQQSYMVDVQPTTTSNSTTTPPPSTDPMDFSFDWDAWDAVFNQYSGFSDFLDDVSDLHGVKPLQ